MTARGFEYVYGVDEVGRGPIAGPVVAAACRMPLGLVVPGVADSKTVSEKKREKLFVMLTTSPDVTWAVSVINHDRIDEINIFAAAMEAMGNALAACVEKHDDASRVCALVDGNKIPPGLTVHAEAVVGGDAAVRCIAAASIIAKVTRDRLMCEYDAVHPEYGFARHKGYPTREHRESIEHHGPCDIHRHSFRIL